MTDERDILDRLAELARTGETPLAERSMDEIAQALGMTRMTLYRKAGSRQQIVARLADSGIDARRAPNVRERVVEATAELMRERSLADITLDAIAERARCSLPAIYDQFGNRQGVLRATFEQHSPLPAVEQLVASGRLEAEPDLRQEVHMLYGAVFDQVTSGWPVLRAFIAEVMRDPDSEVGVLFREWYMPRALGTIRPTIQRHLAGGSFRPLSPVLIGQAFVGPLLLHIASRGVLRQTFGIDPLDRDLVIDTLADMFCRAVAAEPPEGPSV